MKKYLVVGGPVISDRDQRRRYVNAEKLMQLYGLKPEQCVLIEERYLPDRLGGIKADEFTILRPRSDDNYVLPTA